MLALQQPYVDGSAPPLNGALCDDRVGLLLGHEHNGVPDDVLSEVDECIEIPMVGWGASLNVAVAGSLLAYRLAGLS